MSREIIDAMPMEYSRQGSELPATSCAPDPTGDCASSCDSGSDCAASCGGPDCACGPSSCGCSSGSK